MTEHFAMSITGTSALVTGANRGLGRSFVRQLLDRGAARVYAGARRPESIDTSDDRVVAVKLDITDPGDVAAAADRCGDISVLINNAGTMFKTPFLAAPDLSTARTEMETNYFGTLAMSRAFAPILAAHAGGALVNILSVVSFYSPPFNGSYCASKSAQWALTNSLRIELRQQRTLVVGVHAGFIDTDMAASVAEPKISPADVANQTLDAIERGEPEVLADEWTRHVKASVPTDQHTLYPDIAKSWEANESPWQD